MSEPNPSTNSLREGLERQGGREVRRRDNLRVGRPVFVERIGNASGGLPPVGERFGVLTPPPDTPLADRGLSPAGQDAWCRGARNWSDECRRTGKSVVRVARLRERASYRNHQRRGNVLVLFAMLFFGLMALAALVIDIGLTRLTQRQMQSAADVAALEGLRYRDQLPPDSDLEDETPTPAQLDEQRRRHAKRMVAWMYDGDPSVADINFGARDAIAYSEGVGDPDTFAQPLLSAPVTVYEPGDESAGLQLNLTDQPDGDMVAGRFKDLPADATAEQIRNHHRERPDYSRDDFVYADEDDGHEAANAFMVRLRRTGEVFAEEGVASAGPPLPYIFAWGSFFPRIRSESNPHILADGIKVRATGLADARPAVAVGSDYWDDHRILGALPFAIMPVIDGDTEDSDADTAPSWKVVETSEALTRLGQSVGSESDVIAILNNGAEAMVDRPGYIAILDSSGPSSDTANETQQTVIGFSIVPPFQSDHDEPEEPASEAATERIGENASASMRLVQEISNQLIARNASLRGEADTLPYPLLLAPVSVR